jgi:HSP20 family protein
MNVLTELSAARRAAGEEMITLEWTPLIDITEDDEGYLIKAELPEVGRQNLRVTVDETTLTISGERRFAFKRQFALPMNAAGEKASARFKDGVLKVHLPKNPDFGTGSVGIDVG